ncbi:MAG: Ig-like domain-containing protein [Tepidisphaeraceae bacterium]
MLTVCAVDDTVAVRRLDVTLAIDVLANDSATNGALVIDSYTQPAHGTVALLGGTGGARDRLAYTPAGGYAGTDAFTYTVQDDDGVPETADVSVTLAAPAAAVDPGGPRGAGYYALSDGFVVGPFTAYTRSALGNFSFTDSKATDDNSTWTDSDGIVHNVASSGLDTLVDLHRSLSPTYGGRNTPAQIQADALNRHAAAIRDSEAMISGARDAAFRAAAEAAAAKIRQRAGGQ